MISKVSQSPLQFSFIDIVSDVYNKFQIKCTNVISLEKLMHLEMFVDGWISKSLTFNKINTQSTTVTFKRNEINFI